MPLFTPAPEPPTALGRYRTLSPLASVHVSPLALGGMSIGENWGEMMGAMDKESSFKLMDAFYEAGGNFIDTANNYQNESSEKIIGEWMEQRGNRDEMVIATKYTTDFKMGQQGIQHASFVGNNTKSLHVSVEASLKKLRTSYIDILYVHWWDYSTSIEEVMNSLHNLVVSGKVLYLGISDTPAWIVAQCNQYARDHSKSPFVVYQGAWNVLERSFERDIIPMARANGLALAPWNVLAAGKLRSDEEEKKRLETGENGRDMWGVGWQRNEDQTKMSRLLEKIGKEVGGSISAVAIAYVMQKTPYVFPIIGGRKVEHLKQNIAALSINLTPEHIAEIEGLIPFDVGFPHTMLGDGTKTSLGIDMAVKLDRVPVPKAAQPHH